MAGTEEHEFGTDFRLNLKNSVKFHVWIPGGNFLRKQYCYPVQQE
jgi:hypothetical protein